MAFKLLLNKAPAIIIHPLNVFVKRVFQCTILQCTMKERTGVRLCPFGHRIKCDRTAFVYLDSFGFYMRSLCVSAGGLILVFYPINASSKTI